MSPHCPTPSYVSSLGEQEEEEEEEEEEKEEEEKEEDEEEEKEEETEAELHQINPCRSNLQYLNQSR